MNARWSLCWLGMLLLWPSLVLSDTTRGLQTVQIERRTALVIGNGAYPVSPLRNPVNDARDVARVLQERHFQVTLLQNADRRQITQAIHQFGQDLKAGGVGLFYYAGHGMQVKGRNYLIPTDARIHTEGDVEFESVDVGRVLEQMEAAGNRLNMLILDACRDNPFTRSFRSSTQGLAPPDAPVGTLVAYPTGPGQVARDGEQRNGIYTKRLLEQMQVPGQEVSQMFKNVRTGVRNETNDQQVPTEWTSLEGNFYFTPATSWQATASPVAVVVSAARSSAAEEEMWNLVKDSTDASDFEAFLNAFPDGVYASVAQLHLKYLTADQTSTPSRLTSPATAPTRSSTAEIEMWNLVKNSTDASDFKAFLDAFPDGEYAAVARLQLKRLTPTTVPALRDRAGFVLIQPGRFQMGSNDGASNEQYVHTVDITRPFYIAEHEVTVGEFQKFLLATRYPAPQCGQGQDWQQNGQDYAVTCVSWNDAQAYIHWLNQDRPGQNFRLCTEAEWEYAARAGTTTPWSCGNQAACLDEANPQAARQSSQSYAKTLPPIKTTKPNPWQLYDMHGSVWEWVQDYYGSYYAKEAAIDPVGPPSGAYRVKRGGGFSATSSARRSSSRDYVSPTAHLTDLGFRLCGSP